MAATGEKNMKDLFLTLPQVGRVDWIGLRTERRGAIHEVDQVEVDLERGLIGDRFSGKPGSRRMVTLIQAEHITAIAQFLGRDPIDPKELRRNIVVSGVNLLAFKAPSRKFHFSIGGAVLMMTGNCHPCSRMEENLGPGGYNAMRGHGGITTTVIQSGIVKIGDAVKLIGEVES